jgi:hypothetical protein
MTSQSTAISGRIQYGGYFAYFAMPYSVSQ